MLWLKMLIRHHRYHNQSWNIEEHAKPEKHPFIIPFALSDSTAKSAKQIYNGQP
jgi:hypothetical protein